MVRGHQLGWRPVSGRKYFFGPHGNHGFQWKVATGARKFASLWRHVAACGALWHPVAAGVGVACGILWRRTAAPIILQSQDGRPEVLKASM